MVTFNFLRHSNFISIPPFCCCHEIFRLAEIINIFSVIHAHCHIHNCGTTRRQSLSYSNGNEIIINIILPIYPIYFITNYYIKTGSL